MTSNVTEPVRYLRHQVVAEWNDTCSGYPRTACIHDLFEEWVRRTPDAVALVEAVEGTGGGRRWTYAELAARAERLAARLRRLGVGPDVPVAFALERSAEMIVALLAILEAGGAYAPLDPSHPRERLRGLLEQLGSPVLITEPALLGRLPAPEGVAVVLAGDEPAPAPADHPEPPLPRAAVDPSNLAYILFTSGTTGTPKGVPVPHRAVVRLVRETNYARLDAGEVFLQLAPIAFDASTFEIWGALANGATLVIHPAAPPSLDGLGEVIARYGVSTLWLTAGLFHQMVEHDVRALAPLRQLLTGGDVVSAPHARRVLEALPGLRVINGYGPTENTTFTCCRPTSDPSQLNGVFPIGRPISGSRALLLDAEMRPVAVGEDGELYAGGDGLARGYLGRPDLTALSFVPDPTGEPGARLYRTGDLARWRPSGEIEFLGRRDAQVKVRGFRIELGEIEAALAAHPGVAGAAVVARPGPGGAGDTRLAAFVVARPDAAPGAAELRRSVAERLPEPMVPSQWVFLDSLPLTPNGKVDRRALLREESLAEAAVEGERVAPRTATERALAGIWRELLGLATVGVRDDFFELGGHSLLATRLLTRLRDDFGAELSLAEIFEEPTIEALAAAIDRGQEAEGLAPIPPVPRHGPLPASFPQRRLWFIDRLTPGLSLYNVPFALRVRGPLDVAALEAAWNGLLRRHESLRTTFAEVEGEPVQVIAPFEPVALPVLEIAEAEAARWLAAEVDRPFDLARGPLIRFGLLRLAPEDWILWVVLHHIVCDGWSIEVLTRDLGELYAGRALPELPIQYADFAVWQIETLRGETLAREVEHWRRELAGAPGLIELPSDRPRPAVRSFRGAQRTTSLPAAVAEGVRALGRDSGATPFMVLLAAFQALLGRLTGQTDVLVGSPIANRRHRELEGLIGFFVNTLILRARPEPGLPFRELLAQVRKTALDAYAHQDLPFERLVEELRIERGLSHNPLFQVTFALQPPPGGELELPGASLTLLETPPTTAKFDLGLTLWEVPAGLAGTLDYAADLYDAPTADRLLEHLGVLLAGLVSAPDLAIEDLPLLSEPQRHQVVSEWNDTRSAYPRRAIHELVEEQARLRPDAVAIVEGEHRFTYAELDARADRLARRLRRLGVGPEVPATFLLERSAEMIVALLAILKAGGAYAPLDPASPRERLAWLIEHLGSPVLITEPGLLERLPSLPEGVEVVLPSEDAADHPTPLPRVAPDGLAYILFTSGTTGTPKGVAVPHRAVVRLVRDTGFARLDAGEVFLQLAPVAFDASTLEIWGALANGATLAIYPSPKPSLEELGRVLARHRVSTLWLTAGLFHQMVEHDVRALAPVRQLLAGGDVVSAAHVRTVLEALPGIRVINGYGPTENTTFTCCHGASDPAAVGATFPIGRPISGSRALLLDPAMRPVPVGVAGELYAGGDGLARGYFGRPDLTAAAFVPDPSGEPGARLYRTGDLAVRKPTGEIEFLGRRDDQVKVRGFRIEPGEIEAVLEAHPGVAAAAVLALSVAGDKRLAAFVVPRSAEAVEAPALRAFLHERLPEPMIPSLWAFLDALPLTPNGKVDRRALAQRGLEGEARAAVAGERLAPRTATERALAALWIDLLGLDAVGVRDSFFELGGHSLLATRFVARVRDAFGVELPLASLFVEPTIEALAAELDSVLTGNGPEPIPHVAGHEGLLPSFAQERLWFLDRLAPGQSVYNMPLALRFAGALDVAALAGAVDALVRRHEPLRTTFTISEDGPRQIVHPPPASPLPTVDLRGLPSGEEEAGRVLGAEARRPFDLERGPLFRATLVRISDADAVLLLCMHHTVSDGWSFRVIVSDLAALYRAPLPELPVRYADFAAWQRERLRGAEGERQLSYWLEALRGAPTRLDLPADRPRPPVQRFRGALRTCALPEAVVRETRELARRSGATPFMVLLAAFQALLHRYTGQDDLLVGTPVSGRGRRELEGMVGLFVNTLVMRARMADGRVSFRELVESNREATLRGLDRQELPFERLVDALAPERDLSQSPLFQVMFSHNESPAPVALPGVAATSSEVDIAAAKFDLLLGIAEEDEGWSASWSYDADLFDAWRIERMAGHFETLLAAALAEPDRPVADLPLLRAAEREELRGWNSWTADYEGAACLHELIEAQVERTPEAVALVFEGATLTYRELDERASRLAAWLRRQGVTTDRLVGISAERSFELLVGLIGILKAGGAYVPIDPSLPAERQAYMVEDSGVEIVLTQALLREASQGDERLPHGSSRAMPDSLAYLIYTSGSTGRPKGAGNAHHAIRNRLLWGQATFDLKPEDRVLQKTPFSFDVSVWELFWPLIVGARLVIARPGGHQDPGYLADLIEREGITTIHFVPSMLRAFLETPGLERCRTIRRAVCSGEALPPDLARLYFERMPGELHNLYGPTEAAVEVTWWPCRPADRLSNVPIGRPIANTQIWLLDRHGWPVPAGVPGELLIAGVQPARGYHRRPELTAEKFVPDAQSPVPGAWGARCYRSGDLARWRPDGAIEYLGRIDHQVKIRGFRIELGEIESALADQPGVRESVVVALPRGLVAYVVSTEDRPDREAWFDELRTGLKERLPDYMVPPVFVLLEALPLNPNGKVDRKALPKPEEGAVERVWEEPATELERRLAGLFAELLGLPEGERVGRRDPFFELGGNSITAAILINRLQRALGRPLPVVAIFEAPTVAELAERIERLPRGDDTSAIPRIEHGPETELPLSFSQERLWFVDQLDPGNPSSNVFAPLRLNGILDAAALAATLTEMVRRHEVLRTTFGSREGKPYQRIAPPSPQPLPRVDLSALSATAAEAEGLRLTRDEGMRGFDLTQGPVLRTILLRLGASSWILLFNMHHVVSDGWSLGVVVEELRRLYEAFSRGLPPDLPELPVQMADFAAWQRGWLQGERLEQEVEWWRRELAGAPPRLDLPLDRPRPPAHRARGAHLHVELPRDLSRSTAALGQRHGATLFMTLLAAFDLLMHRLSGQDDLVVGTPVAGRNRAEVEPMIGCFINTLALRSRLESSATFAGLLRQTRATTLGAFTHQDLPFERVVEGLQVPRNLSHTPVYQVLFALQNTPMGKLEMGGLGIELIDLETDTANFALSLGLVEGEDGLWGSCIYDTDLLDAATVERWMGHYRGLLAWAVEHAERPLAELPPLAEPERRPASETRKEEASQARHAAREEGVKELRAGLSDQKRAALEKLMRGRGRSSSG
jgi:amino acid adenylation domain-containing protein